MKKHFWRKTTAMALSTVLAASSLPMLGSLTAGAIQVPQSIPMSNDFYYKNESLQPYGACFQAEELRNWTPDNDPDARYNQSGVALKDRWMGPNVNPNASRDAKVYPLAMSNPRASEGPSQGGDGDFVYAFTNFQYVDTYNFWGGSSAEGAIAIPSPEHIDSAHRNGVPATGTIFIPWGDSQYGNEFIRQMMEQDDQGNFIMADKLIEIAEYYGFEGYIINHESGGHNKFKDFLAYIQQKKPDGFTMTWYNGSGTLTSGSVTSWMQDGDKRINDEWWLDMSWGSIDSTIAAAKQNNRSPFDIHASWEYFPYLGKGGRIDSLIGADQKLKVSLGILSPTVTLTQSSDSSDFQNVQDQTLWVGPTFDPRSTTRGSVWPGFANLIADQTPIIGSEFVTTFTTGNGYKFYENGVVTGKENGWYNRSMTGVLPTWRWIIDSEGQKLEGSIDYNDAYFAGTSLKFNGNLDAGKANHIKLYSAQLDIEDDSKLSVTYKTPANKGVKMSVGLCFGDTYDDANFKFYDVDTTTDGEWTTATVDLGEDAGKTAIAISMKFASDADVSDYAINIGRLAITTAEADAVAPEKVTGVTYDEVIYPTDTTAEARVYWDKAKNADMYEVRRIHADGSKEFIGSTPNNAYYFGNFAKDGDESSFYFEITPVSENGTAGEVTTLKFKWPNETNGFAPIQEAGENIALKKPAVSTIRCEGDGPVDKLNDGVITLSKWCGQAHVDRGAAVIDLGEERDISRWVVYHANCRGAGEGVAFNTIDFDLMYAPDDGQPLLDGDTQASKNRVNAMAFTTADVVNGNTDDITDRNLSQPIKARYVKLNVRHSGSSPWIAIRIYEFELYEHNYTSAPTPLLARNVTVENNEGATDRVTLNNVPMPSTTGNTGLVKLYRSMDDTEPFAQVKATQPNQSYRERNVGIANFTDLDLGAEGGRLYYSTVVDGYAAESPRYSVVIPPETGEAIPTPEMTLEATAKGVQLNDAYGVMTLSGLPEGTSLKVYDSADSMIPILFASEIPEGSDSIRMERIPLKKDGGTFYYVLSKDGSPDSERIAVNYENPADMAIDATTLPELIEKYQPVIDNKADYVPSTFTAFEEAFGAAKALMEEENVTAAQAEEARAAMMTAFASVRSIADTQRISEYIEEVESTHAYDQDYTEDEWNGYQTALNALKGLVNSTKDGTNPADKLAIEKARIALDAAKAKLETPKSIDITPVAKQVRGARLNLADIDYTVNGKGGSTVSQDVSWSLAGGNTSSGTYISTSIWYGSYLYIGSDEASRTVTLRATSQQDSSVYADLEITIRQQGAVILPEIENAAITADKEAAFDDETVTVTVTPNKGYRVKKGSLTMNGEPIENNTFVMPSADANIEVVIEKAAVMDVINAVIEKAEQLKAEGALEGTMEAVVTEFNAALEAAKAIDPETAYQPDINAATVRLLSVMAKVDWKQGDKTVLEVAFEVAQSINDNLDLYVDAGKAEFTDAFNRAEELLASGNAWQDDIDAAVADLIEAMSNMRMKANKDILNGMIEQAGALNLSGYTADSANALKAALENAKTVAQNDAATQDEVDAAVANLAAARAGLVKANGGSTQIPVQDTGDGSKPSAPTQTGDAGSMAAFGMMALAAAAVVLFKKKRG
ncbi:MAG: hypothetical protein HFE39_09975 [Clostridiales bacterium]|jgi:endo-beta-N-acetylglucosaminidase D|nr:hypothetical protein [Clostridiales bacterium]